MAIPEKSLYYTPGNVKEIMKALMQESLTNLPLRATLESDASAKVEIGKYLVATPENWEKIKISFRSIALDDDEIVDRFHGLIVQHNDLKGIEVTPARGSRCCIRCHDAEMIV